jgi:hypothetical protein
MTKGRGGSKSGSGDLFASIRQTAADKLLDSTSYPVKVLDERKDFPGCDRAMFRKTWPVREYTTDELGAMFRKAIQQRSDKKHDPETAFNHRILSFGGSIIEQAKKAADAAADAGGEYSGPPIDVLQAIVKGGVKALPATIRPLGDWGAYAHLAYLGVTMNQRPSIQLASPRIDLDGVKITVEATGELWIKYPWFNCYQWCFSWEKVIKCDRVASITISVDIAADAHAIVESSGPQVYVRAEFDKLRLDYPILRDIPLEGIANAALGNKPIFVYDASKFVTVVPVLESKFTVGEVLLPASANSVDVGVTLKQI